MGAAVADIPYAIVHACHALGLHRPEDVGWLERWHDAEGKMLPTPKRGLCLCGDQEPKPQLYEFTYSSGQKVRYFVAQCKRCHTVHWEYKKPKEVSA